MSACFSWLHCRPNRRFTLDRLPYDVLYEILQYLPFDQRVRIARVNRRLRDISEMTVSRTKTFHMTAPCFRRITMESMANLIELCAARMENLIVHVKMIEELWAMQERLQLLWGLPRLTNIILETGYGMISLFGLIQEILVKIPSLRSLKWEDGPCGIDDTQQIVACESLERVDLKLSLSPSLTRVQRFTSVLNNCSNLKHLALRQRAVECITNMSRMDSLESLILDNTYYSISKGSIYHVLLEKIPDSFPQLVNLEMRLYTQCACHGVVDEEEGWLSRDEESSERQNRVLSQLQRSLLQRRCTSADPMQKSANGRLPSSSTDVNPTTMLDFARHCPQLRKLTVRDIGEIDSATAANGFVVSLADFVQQNLTIILQEGNSNVWQCAEVETALNVINRKGRRLSIEMANVNSIRVGNVVDPWEWKEPVKVVVPESKARKKSRCQKMMGRVVGAFRRSKQ